MKITYTNLCKIIREAVYERGERDSALGSPVSSHDDTDSVDLEIAGSKNDLLLKIADNSGVDLGWHFDKHPLAASGDITSGATRSRYFSHAHKGIDYPARRDTPIYAIDNGVIVHVWGTPDEYDVYNGWGVDIQHATLNGIPHTSQYIHMNSYPPVEIGESVSKGDVIGYVGNTGKSFGNHLHFQVKQGRGLAGDGNMGIPVDPVKFFTKADSRNHLDSKFSEMPSEMMESFKMKIKLMRLRTIIKEELSLYESTRPDKSVSDEILKAIIDSEFWKFSHKESDVDLVDDHTFSTDAVEVLMDALNDKAVALESDLYFILSVTDEEIYTLDKDDPHGRYPNNWLMRGQYRGPEKGKHIVWLEFSPLSDTYDMSHLDENELAKIISRTINHELVHYNQLKKQAEQKGISEEEAWEELQCDPNQLQVTNPEEWEEKCGRKPPETVSGRPGYISLHNEIDAFAYEASEELLDKYTPDQVLDLIRYDGSNAVGILGDYKKYLKNDRKSLERFLTKLYTHIERSKDEV